MTKITLEQIKKLGRGDIITYSGSKALEAVKQDGYALQYVNEGIFQDDDEIIIINGEKYKKVK